MYLIEITVILHGFIDQIINLLIKIITFMTLIYMILFDYKLKMYVIRTNNYLHDIVVASQWVERGSRL